VIVDPRGGFRGRGVFERWSCAATFTRGMRYDAIPRRDDRFSRVLASALPSESEWRTHVMHFLGDLLSLLALASLGIFFGAMLTEGLVLVPYWRSLPAEDFYAWYGANDARLLGFFGPLTWLAALSALAAAGISWWTVGPDRWYAAAAAVCVLVVVSMFFAYFARANASFSLARMPEKELRAELDRWAAWHRLRSALSLAALTAAALAAWQ
jgi:hypothetical protein